LSQLRARLLELDETAGTAEVLRYQSQALNFGEHLDGHLIRLAQIFEECKYGQNTILARHTICTNFWDRVIAAQAALKKKENFTERINLVFPTQIFAYYGWFHLGQSGLQCLAAIAKFCAELAPKDKRKAWGYAVVELNREMLRRDRRTRVLRRERPYVGKLIGEHYPSSKIQDARSPLETQDFNNAWENMRKWPSGKKTHNEWDWTQQETMTYLRQNNLSFDKNGTIVTEDGRLDETLLKLYLPPMQKRSAMTRHGRQPHSPNPGEAWETEIPLAHKSFPKVTASGTRPCSPPGNNHPYSTQHAEDSLSLNQQEHEDGDTNLERQSEDPGDKRDTNIDRERSPGLSRHTFSNYHACSSERQESSVDGVVRIESQVSHSRLIQREGNECSTLLDAKHKILEAVELIRTSYADVDATKGQEIESLLRTALEALAQD
jgi:hypothetical protein